MPATTTSQLFQGTSMSRRSALEKWCSPQVAAEAVTLSKCLDLLTEGSTSRLADVLSARLFVLYNVSRKSQNNDLKKEDRELKTLWADFAKYELVNTSSSGSLLTTGMMGRK